jgi:hypothetical protein
MRALLLLVLLGSHAALAATTTSLTFSPLPPEVRYSQGVNVEVELRDHTGTVIDGACDPDGIGLDPCVVVVEVAPTGSTNPAEVISVTAPDVVVDAAGRARTRLTFVDGRYGSTSFVADAEGASYTITARFPGNGRVDDADCQRGAEGVANGLYCPSTASTTILLFPEVPALIFTQDVEIALGDTVTLAATLRDDTGNAELASSDLDGSGPLLLEGLPVRFFYDADNNGRPSASERIGEAVTNAFGVASFEFVALPPDVVAGSYPAGLHAEFPGNGGYALARTAVALTVSSAADPDPSRTIIEVTPDVISLDAASDAVVRVRLVDANNNILGADAAAHDVVIATDFGRLIDAVDRDALDGSYSQVIRAPRETGTATISVTVDGVAAGSVQLGVEGPAAGCTCANASAIAPAGALLTLLGVAGRRRRWGAGG